MPRVKKTVNENADAPEKPIDQEDVPVSLVEELGVKEPAVEEAPPTNPTGLGPNSKFTERPLRENAQTRYSTIKRE